MPTEVKAAGTCPNGNVFTKLITDVCWDCMLPINVGGIPLGQDRPDGASEKVGLCNCPDDLGIPEFGYPLPMWMPSRVSEVVTTPWCSPALGGIKLQDDVTAGMGGVSMGEEGRTTNSFQQYHWFASPFAEMLEMFFIPECNVDGLTDFDLMYLSEIDPMHSNDLLSLLLFVEAIAFATPATSLWCAADCAMITAGIVKEDTFGCAGCDGSLYPITGNSNAPDGTLIRSSSLITQRVIAGLHRKNLATKTIGDEAMCGRVYWPTTPRSQYKMSMIYPKAEADPSPTETYFQLDGEGNVLKEPDGSPKPSGTYEHSGKGCCHPLGESTMKWAVPRGGMTEVSNDDYIYLIYRYKDCCVRSY